MALEKMVVMTLRAGKRVSVVVRVDPSNGWGSTPGCKRLIVPLCCQAHSLKGEVVSVKADLDVTIARISFHLQLI